jgi:hypothetical protein
MSLADRSVTLCRSLNVARAARLKTLSASSSAIDIRRLHGRYGQKPNTMDTGMSIFRDSTVANAETEAACRFT